MKGIEFGISSNVSIRVVNGKNGRYKDYFYHNKATKSMILGIWKFLRGSDDLSTSDYSPNYLRVGDGSSSVTFTDTSLDDMMYSDGTLVHNYTDGTIPYGTNAQVKDYSETTNSITLGIRFYMNSNDLQGSDDTATIIREMGLYSNSGILLARVVLDDEIEKYKSDFVDILWEITITSVDPS